MSKEPARPLREQRSLPTNNNDFQRKILSEGVERPQQREIAASPKKTETTTSATGKRGSE